jgi:hypothetical protein
LASFFFRKININYYLEDWDEMEEDAESKDKRDDKVKKRKR